VPMWVKQWSVAGEGFTDDHEYRELVLEDRLAGLRRVPNDACDFAGIRRCQRSRDSLGCPHSGVMAGSTLYRSST
jgi:hypothetical protein